MSNHGRSLSQPNLTLNKVSPKYLLDSPVMPFRLAIGLWMESGRHQETSTKNTMQCLPKVRGESTITVANYARGYTIEAYNVIEKQTSNLPARQIRLTKLAGDQPTQLGQTIDNRQHGIGAVGRLR